MEGASQPVKTLAALKSRSARWFGPEDAGGGRDAALLRSLEEAVEGRGECSARAGEMALGQTSHSFFRAPALDRRRAQSTVQLSAVERGGDPNTVTASAGQTSGRAAGPRSAKFSTLAIGIGRWGRASRDSLVGRAARITATCSRSGRMGNTSRFCTAARRSRRRPRSG